MKDRVILIRKTLGLKQYEFAEKLKIKPTTLSMIENGNSILTDKNIQMICLTFGVNEKWLRYGMGEMFIKNFLDIHNTSGDARELLDLYQKLEEPTKRLVLNHAKQMLVLQEQLLNKPESDPLPIDTVIKLV
ncbi:helix-turn-helix domain-containing protein [Breznakiellaceae bacterium SP9]